MSEGYRQIANSIWMWLACVPGILLVCLLAGLFLRHSIKNGKALGLTGQQMKSGIKSAAIASVGPCLVMLSSMLSLMVIVGSPFAWLRINVVGGAGYEIMGATFAADAMGISAGGGDMTVDYLCVASVVMTAGCLGWIIFAALFANKMERVNRFMAGGSMALIPIVSASCAMGCYSNLVAERVWPVSKNTLAACVSGLVMFLLLTAAKRWKLAWLKSWALTISMLCGMLSGMAAA